MFSRYALDDCGHECTRACTRSSADGCTLRCAVTGRVVYERPPDALATRRTAGRAEGAAQRSDAFAATVRSMLARLLNSASRSSTETRRSQRARSSAAKRMRAMLAEAAAGPGRVRFTRIMHAVWGEVERAGGDSRTAVRLSESTKNAAVAACVDYYATYVMPYPRREQRPADKYLALALLYGLPGVRHAAHAAVRQVLPDLRTLKHYNLAVHKFTCAQRFVSCAAANKVAGRV